MFELFSTIPLGWNVRRFTLERLALTFVFVELPNAYIIPCRCSNAPQLVVVRDASNCLPGVIGCEVPDTEQPPVLQDCKEGDGAIGTWALT